MWVIDVHYAHIPVIKNLLLKKTIVNYAVLVYRKQRTLKVFTENEW